MTRQPLDRKRICEVLESCRAGSNDLMDPAFADVSDHLAASPEWERVSGQIQNADQKISAAFHDVEIPPGLEERLMASLRLSQAHDAVSLALQGSTAESFAPSVTVPAVKKALVVSRRWFLVSGGMLATAAAIFLAIFLNINKDAGYSEQTVREEAIRYFDADLPSAQGRLLAENAPPKDFPVSKEIVLFRGIRWRIVQNLMGQSAVAFDLPGQGGARATLYAFYGKTKGLSTSPSLRPFTTGGRSSAAWVENGLVYVLVVQGNQNSYEKYLNVPRGPVA